MVVTWQHQDAAKKLKANYADCADEMPPPADFLMTPEQHRRRAQELSERSRPDLAKHHEILERDRAYLNRIGIPESV
jgi:hypothetical protein